MALHPWIRRAAPIGALLLFATTPARATVVRAMSLEEKCQRAPVIVLAEVLRTESRWDDEGAGIFTFVTVKVEEGLKGERDPGGRLIVQLGGGTVEGVTAEVAGTSSYEPGELAVLFLEPVGAHYVEIGVGIGKYPVEVAGGERWVSFAPKVSELKPGARSPEPVEGLPRQPLDGFLKRVRSHVAQIPVGLPQPRKTPMHRPVLEKHPRPEAR